MLLFKKNTIAFAVLMALSGGTMAGVGDITVNGNVVTVPDASNSFTLGTAADDVTITGKDPATYKDVKQAVILNGHNKTATINGKTITLKSTLGLTVQSQNRASINLGSETTSNITVSLDYKSNGNKCFSALTAENSEKASAADPVSNTHIRADANNINVTAKLHKDIWKNASVAAAYVGSGASVALTGHGANSSISLSATGITDKPTTTYGIWLDNNTSKQRVGGQMTLTGSNVSISATGNHDVRAIHVGSNTLTPVKESALTINADRVNIESIHTANGTSYGIVAMSKGIVKITGDTTVTADDAIVARGESNIDINSDGRHFTQINGNINFAYDADSSGSPVDATVNLNLTGASSHWTGNTKITYGPSKPPAGYENVSGMSLTLNDGAQWTPTAVAVIENEGSGQNALPINTFDLNNGIVNIADNTVDVHIKNLEGSGGTVKLGTDLTRPEGQQTGTLSVDTAASGSSLNVQLMDAQMAHPLTSDEVNATQAKNLISNVGGKNATGKDVVSVSTSVGEGMYNPAFGIDTEGNSYQAGANSLMQANLELASIAPLALNRILMNDVRKRLGDIRSAEGLSGAWARYDGGRLSGSKGLENDFHTIQVGLDTQPTADTLRFGVALSYTKSDAEYARGSADMDAYSLAGYGLWLGERGQFVDVVARMATAKTDMLVDGNKKGDMDNVALSLSGEFGWRIDLTNQLYVEPQLEATYTYIDAENLKLSDGSSYHYDAMDSLLGRAGVALGIQCPNNKGNVYARVSAVHEFLGDAAITGGNAAVYEVDGKDTWVEYGLGASFNLTKFTYIWADVERTSGGILDEDYRATVGVRYAW